MTNWLKESIPIFRIRFFVTFELFEYLNQGLTQKHVFASHLQAIDLRSSIVKCEIGPRFPWLCNFWSNKSDLNPGAFRDVVFEWTLTMLCWRKKHIKQDTVPVKERMNWKITQVMCRRWPCLSLSEWCAEMLIFLIYALSHCRSCIQKG